MAERLVYLQGLQQFGKPSEADLAALYAIRSIEILRARPRDRRAGRPHPG